MQSGIWAAQLPAWDTCFLEFSALHKRNNKVKAKHPPPHPAETQLPLRLKRTIGKCFPVRLVLLHMDLCCCTQQDLRPPKSAPTKRARDSSHTMDV